MAQLQKLCIAIIGGGPSALFMYKRLVESEQQNLDIHIFERKSRLGAGMPYSEEGACNEHITNVSDNEIPSIACTIEEWVNQEPNVAATFKITPTNFNEFKVLPRLLFGSYLESQFKMLVSKASHNHVKTTVHLSVQVKDLVHEKKKKKVSVVTEQGESEFDVAVICIGHYWPKKFEGKIPGFYDSPYPPIKLNLKLNHPVAIKGASLTAIDAIRTLSRKNGKFDKSGDQYSYQLDKGSENFRIVMHSRNGFLPAVRFHLEDSHLRNDALLKPDEIARHRKANGGFLSLDFIFENDFINIFKEKDIEFYEKIKSMSMEEFVDHVMGLREKADAFTLLEAEYLEAEKSIRTEKSVYWKELLGVLSFAMNQPAKYFSAEDMLRLQKTLMPLISIVIAYVPQSSCEDLMALHNAGILEIVAVGDDSEIIPQEQGGIIYSYKNEDEQLVEIKYQTYVNCVGQEHFSFNEFPFQSFLADKTISQATLKYQSAEAGVEAHIKKPDKVVKLNNEYYLKVPGITINDDFQIVDEFGIANNQVYMMAVPYISGYNPDYSGLDFCEATSKKIAQRILSNF